TIGKTYTWKEERIYPYHDLESRFKFEEELIQQHIVNQNALILKNKEFEKHKAAKKQRKLPGLLKKSRSIFVRKQEQLFTDYFNGTIRENEIIRHISPIRQHARDIIKRMLKESIAISLEGKDSQFLYLKDRNSILTILCPKAYSEIQVLSQNSKIIKKILNSSLSFNKKHTPKTAEKKELSIPHKKVTTKQVFSYTLGLAVLLSILFLPIMMLLPSSSSLFPNDFKVNFPFLQTLVFSLSLVIYTWNRILSRQQTAYISIASLTLFIFSLLTKNLITLPISIFITPILLIFSFFIFKKTPSIQKVTHKKQRNLKTALYSLDIKYHKNKYRLLWHSMFVLLIIFWIVFIYFPQMLYIPTFLFIVSIVIFTKNTNFEKRKWVRRSDRNISGNDRGTSYYNSKIYRSACLILVFLILMPLLFTVSSMVRVNRPNTLYAQIPQESRIESSFTDLSTLTFFSSVDELGDLSINDKFLLKSRVSTSLGESAKMAVRFTPEDVEPIEGYIIKDHYNTITRRNTGPLTDFDLITEIALNNLDLLPGSYRMENTYSVLTGFAYREAESEFQSITIGKDNLKAIPSKDYELGIEYGAVYTIRRSDSWEIIYDGTIINSLHEPVPVKNLTLYLEDFDKFIEVATLDTDEDANFYFNYTKFGSIEQNPLVRIVYEGDGFYEPLAHVEYAGVEMGADQNWWFYDNDKDGRPEWPFTLYDLYDALRLAGSSPSTSPLSDSLFFMTEFDENLGSSTFDKIFNLEGTLEGNTSWISGRRNSGLYFDGDGNIIGGGGQSIGTTIYNTYTNVSYEYNISGSSTDTGWVSPQTSTTVDRSGIDWSNSANIGTQNDIYASSFLNTSAGGGDYLIVPSAFTDVSSQWSTESSAYDWDNLTSATENQGRIINDIYWQSWNNAGSGTISSVDIRLYLDLVGLSNDRLDIYIYVGTSQSSTTYRIDSSNGGTGLYIDLKDVNEPNDGSWSWADVGNIEVRLDGSKTGGHDSVQVYEVFEVWGMVHTSGGGSVESDWLRATNFDFSSIPDGSDITGIELELDRKTTIGAIKDLDVRLRRTSGQVGDNKLSASYWDTIDNDAYDTYGGPSDTWNAGLSTVNVKNGDFGIDIAVINDGSDDTAFVDHIQIKIFYTEPDTLIQNNDIIRPDGDVAIEWEASHVENHFSLINETTLNISEYIFTSSIASSNITDEFSLSTFNINGGSITQIQIKVYGEEILINSTIKVTAGAWSGLRQLNMGSTPGWNAYTWSGLSLSQSDLDGMTVLIESEPPPESPPSYNYFDYVDFGDVLDSVLGDTNDEFVITSWIYPTMLTSNQSSNNVKNVFFTKEGSIEIGVNESGFLELYMKTDTIQATARYGIQGLIRTNDWNYIAIRYNKSDVDVFVNDFWYRNATGGTAEPWSGSSNISPGENLIIGTELTDYTCFTGILDDISVFNGSILDAEIVSHSNGPVLEIDTEILKENGIGVWTPLITPETIDGWLTFKVNSTGKPIESLEFYLSTTEPDLQNPNPNNWYLFSSNLLTDTVDSWDIPDNSSWYFVAKATDDIGVSVYDSFNVYFGVDHFNDLINFTYLDKGGRINDNSQIGVIPVNGKEWHISSINLYINYSGNVDYLMSVSYSELSNYWTIPLDPLSDWISFKGLSPDDYNISFIMQANLTYDNPYPNYINNFTLPQIILDIKGPEISLLTGGPYSLNLGSTYNNVIQNLITMALNSSDKQLDLVKVEYKYDTPTSASWITYNSFPTVDGLANVVIDLLNLRDDNITVRFTGYDNLSNSKVLYESNYWFIKNFNNHLEFTLEGLESGSLYGLDPNGYINFDLKVYPVDNDITKIMVSTNYETFSLLNPISENNYIYYEDKGLDVDIKLNSTYYNIDENNFYTIPIEIKLYQGTTFITSKELVIIGTLAIFNDTIEISDLGIDIQASVDNVLLSFITNTDVYQNPHGIPYIVNNQPPVVKVFNSYGNLIDTITLYAVYDYLSSINFTDEQNAYSAKSPTSTINVDRNDAGGSGSMILSPATASVLNRNLGGGGSYATSWYSPFLAATIDYGSSEDWTNFNNALAQSDSYASSYLATTGGSGQHNMPIQNDFDEIKGSISTFGDLEYSPGGINTTIDSYLTPGSGGDYLIVPSAFTDVSSQWNTETSAYDWNNLTSATENQGRIINDIYWQSWNNAGSGTISSVDIRLYLDLVGLSNDRLDIYIYVGTSQSSTTYRIDSSNGGTGLYIDLKDVNEPNDGSWSWADVGNIEVRLDGSKTGGHDSVQVYEVFEVWGIVFGSGGAPDSNDVDIEVEWNIINPLSMDYLYWDYFSSTSIDFSVYNYNTLEFEDKTSSPFTFTTDYFDNVSGTCSVKVRFNGTNPSSSFSLDIYQLRVDYTVPIVPSNTDWLRLTDFRFDIPTEVISIDGIIIEIDRYAQYSNSIRDKSIRLRLTSGPVGDDAKTVLWWDTIDDDVNNTYGALDDDWNAGLSVSDINNINFGIVISAENIGSDNTAYIDHVRIKIYYTMPDTSAQDWIFPNKAKLQDNDYANVTFSPASEDTSDWIRLTNFGFDIPTSGVTIDGIEVLLDRQANVSGSIHDFGLYLRNSTGQATGNYANSLISWDILDDNGYNLYGSPTSLWSVSWSATEINLNTFGLDLYIEYNGTVFTNATIDDVQIKVYYTQSPQDQISWTNPAKVSAQDDDEAFVSFSTSTEGSSDWLRLTDFRFNVPLGAIIHGIKVEIDQRATVTSSIIDGEVFILKYGAQIGDDMANSTAWETPDDGTYTVYGNSTYLWGTSWNPSEINNADFGIDLWIDYTGSSSTDARIDHIQITVYYSYSFEVEISDNKFSVPFPSLPVGDELCTIETIKLNETFYEFSYFIDTQSEKILITLLSPTNLDGIYDYTNPISMDFGVSNVIHSIDQFTGSYDFTLLHQDNYTFTAEFYTIEGQISTYSVLTPITIDFQGPQIVKQFENNVAVNPESGSISFTLDDISGIDKYYLNTSIYIDSYWDIQGNLYTFYFNDTSVQEGVKYITFTSNDTLGFESSISFIIFFDKTDPEFNNIVYNKIYGNDLFEINFTISDSSEYTLAFQAYHIATNSYTSNFDFTVISVGSDVWQTLIASESLLNGYYNISVTATDIASNSKTIMIGEFYFDNLYSNVGDIQDQIYVDNENIYNTTLTDILYFNDNKFIVVSANDLLYDNFNWSDYDQTIANQIGIKNITFFYTNPLAWYNLSIAGSLDYDTLTYEITGYGDPLNTDLSNIISIQKLKIGNYTIDKFTILLDGTSILLQIDPQFRYTLSSLLTNQIYAQFYELSSTSNLKFQFNSSTSQWDLLSDGFNYFDISEYLTLQEQESFLFWLITEDGFGNQLLSTKYKGIYDNTIQKNGGTSVFNWNVGTLSNGSGVIIFGSDTYSDSTIQINTTSILPTITKEMDVSRIYIYGSENGSEWNFTGRAYYSGEKDFWNFYWDGDLLASQDNLPPVNYYLKTYLFDRAGNYLTFSININTFDYTQIELLTNLMFGSIFEYNSSSFDNIQDIEGTIQNYFGNVNLWDVISEYYSPIENQWVQLATDPATIYSNGSYQITWDIDADPAFYSQMYNFTYEYLPMQIAPATNNDLWGSWGIFESNAPWQPLVISKVGSNLDISIFEYDNSSGWALDSLLSTESIIPSISGQIFKLFDILGDGASEIIRVSTGQIDVIYFNGTEWQIFTNVTNLAGFEYYSFDIAYDGSTTDTLLAINQEDISDNSYLYLYQFETDYSLTRIAECNSPTNFIPTSIKIANYFSSNDRKAILVGGLIANSYYSQLVEYDFNLEVVSILEDALLGKISVLEYNILK
ncbi:hypothetical protein LCGC14_0809430, partial [marine sediment metagenome]